MRSAILTAGFVLAAFFGVAQDRIIAKSSGSGPIIEHQVTSGETLYGVARKYDVRAAELAKANGFEINRNLLIGETLKIPLVATNFNQKTKKGTPVYYNISEGEGLLSVSAKFNKVALKTLRDWNGMKDDVVKKDQSLVVGYLTGVQVATAKTDEKPAPKKEEVKEVAKKPEVKKEEKKPEEIAAEKIIAKQEVEQTAKTQTAEPVDETGFFKKAFEIGSNPALLTNRTLMAGIFKTDAGRSDRKYYMLMDGIAPGTIVRITNPQNGKMVYAKVLGSMKEVKYSENLNVRISEAAAKAIQIGDTEQFVVTANY